MAAYTAGILRMMYPMAKERTISLMVNHTRGSLHRMFEAVWVHITTLMDQFMRVNGKIMLEMDMAS
jgi:hypothetical protein